MDFQTTVDRITETLKNRGFGIITTIDMKDTFKQKLNLDYRNFRILGACNPSYAFKALTLDCHMGVMLPCNVTVQEHENGEVEVSAINPLQTLDVQSFPHLKDLATEISHHLRAAIDDLHHARKTADGP